MGQNPSSHCRDLACRKMHPHKMMHDPVDIPSCLEASCILCIRGNSDRSHTSISATYGRLPEMSGLYVPIACPPENVSAAPSTPSSILMTRPEQHASCPSCTAHLLPGSIGKNCGVKANNSSVFYATESCLPAINAMFAHTVESRRRVATYPFCEGGKDLHHEGNGRFQIGQGVGVFLKKHVHSRHNDTGSVVRHVGWCRGAVPRRSSQHNKGIAFESMS
jgi:hypothetical protein